MSVCEEAEEVTPSYINTKQTLKNFSAHAVYEVTETKAKL